MLKTQNVRVAVSRATDLVNQEIDTQSLALEVARNQVGMRLPVAELLAQLGVDEETFLQLAQNPLFKKQVNVYKKELEDNGVSFQLKAKIQAEEMLKRGWQIVHDSDTPPAVAVKQIENTVRWAGLDNKSTQDVQSAGSGFSITINIPNTNSPSEKAVIEQPKLEIGSGDE